MEKQKKATILSCIFMGIGQIYNKQYLKGALLAIEELIVLIFGIGSGYFYRSIKGVFTLGIIPLHYENDQAAGDNSTFMMIDGIIAIVAFILVVLSYVANIMDARKQAAIVEKPMYKKRLFRDSFDRSFPAIMLSPVFTVIIFITLVPVISSFLIAFTDYSSPNHVPPRALLNWVGLKNFINLIKLSVWKQTFIGVFIWTFVWAILSTLFAYFFGLLFAALMNSKHIKFQKFWRTIFILPMVIPGFISILTMKIMFNKVGPVNQLLQTLFGVSVDWLSNPGLARGILIFVNTWLALGGNMLLMSGILSNLPTDIYEAADLDGASAFQKFKSITLPLILYSAVPLMVMTFSSSINNYGLISMLTGGGPVNANYSYAGDTDILSSWIYSLTMRQGQYNMGMVISIILFALIALLSIYTIKHSNSFKKEDER
jgi:arabinogalactan oligomer / maltooligosaccharide transport system permease protein